MVMNPHNFVCTNCGACCKIWTKVTPQDIERLKQAGAKEFTQTHPVHKDGTLYLKHDSRGWCVFLGQKKDGQYFCTMYGHRPDVCRAYPFVGGVREVEDCRPRNVLAAIKKDLLEKKNKASKN